MALWKLLMYNVKSQWHSNCSHSTLKVTHSFSITAICDQGQLVHLPTSLWACAEETAFHCGISFWHHILLVRKYTTLCFKHLKQTALMPPAELSTIPHTQPLQLCFTVVTHKQTGLDCPEHFLSLPHSEDAIHTQATRIHPVCTSQWS